MANRSTFPTQIDQFIEHMEIMASELPLLARFQELKIKSNRTPTEDDELATLSIQLRNKLITSEDFNKLQDSITNVQSFFRDNVDGYIQTKQDEFQSYVDDFTDKGEYNSNTQYRKRNTVVFNNETYICLQDVIGIPPNPNQNTIYWAKIAQRGARGEQGIPGTNFRFVGAWDVSRQYVKDEAVRFGGRLFGCMQNVIGIEPNPEVDTAYWALISDKGESTIVATLKNTVEVTNTTSSVFIGIPDYNPNTDSLMVIKNTATLAEGTNYSISPYGDSINSLEGVWIGTTYPITFHFIVTKNVVTDLTFSDGNMIQDESIGLNKLKPEVQDMLNSGGTPIIVSPTQPTTRNALWIDTSK